MDADVVDGDFSESVRDSLIHDRFVGVDTETTGLSWSEDRLQICQFYSRSVGAVIVRVGEDPRPPNLSQVLEDTSTTKVFHFAPFDIRFIASQWDVTLASIACTKAASKMVDPGLPNDEHSLAPLLSREFGVKLDKGAVRTSDWGASVLTEEQIQYAVGDVAYLPDLFERLHRRIVDLGRRSDYAEVCSYMLTDAKLELSGVPNPLRY